MKICRQIIQDINLEVDSLKFCCNTGQLSGVRPSLPYNGGKIERAQYIEYVLNLIDTLQDGKSETCKGCSFLVDVDIDKISETDIKIKNVSMNHFRNLCNCKCIYCGYWKKIEAPKYYVLESIRSLYVNNLLHKDAFFSWGGRAYYFKRI